MYNDMTASNVETDVRWRPLVDAIEQGASTNAKDFSPPVAPAISVLVGKEEDVLFEQVSGYKVLGDTHPKQLSAEDIFDVASITKAVVTSVILMKLVEEGYVNLEDKVTRIIPELASFGKRSITIRNLLNHSSGLPAYVPFYKKIPSDLLYDGARELRYQWILKEISKVRSDCMPGKKETYSDLGFIILGNLIEVITGHRLDKLASELIFAPLGTKYTGFIDLDHKKKNSDFYHTEPIVPTMNCPWRGGLVRGEVNDQNAWSLGGVCAHAGLFSNASDLHKIAADLVKCYHNQGGQLVGSSVIREFFSVQNPHIGGTWGLGWDSPTPDTSTSGRFFSKNSFGHLGYTGCSLWIDLERKVHAITLTNRVFPDDKNWNIKEFRPYIHNLVMTALGYGTNA